MVALPDKNSGFQAVSLNQQIQRMHTLNIPRLLKHLQLATARFVAEKYKQPIEPFNFAIWSTTNQLSEWIFFQNVSSRHDLTQVHRINLMIRPRARDLTLSHLVRVHCSPDECFTRELISKRFELNEKNRCIVKQVKPLETCCLHCPCLDPDLISSESCCMFETACPFTCRIWSPTCVRFQSPPWAHLPASSAAACLPAELCSLRIADRRDPAVLDDQA